MEDVDVLIVGAGASGLGVAAALQRRGLRPIVLDRDERVGGTWSNRYERLCLHTTKRFSGLPFFPIPRDYPRYVPKEMFAGYLQEYARRMDIDVRPGQPVDRIRAEGDTWTLTTPDRDWSARAVVIATGRHNQARFPHWPGEARFRNTLLHASTYRTGRAFAGQRALVVGLGNSGAEIAVDLVEHGAAHVAVSIRTSPPISAREIAGIPIQIIGILAAPFPPAVVDHVGARLRRRGTGDLTMFGLPPAAWGPFTARRPPVIDAGFVAQLKAGAIDVRPGVAHLSPAGAWFADGTAASFDLIVAATGYTTSLSRLVADSELIDGRGFPRHDQAAARGCFFAGFTETPRGLLFESSRAAPGLAKRIERNLAGSS